MKLLWLARLMMSRIFDAFLDDPECGVDNPAFDEFSEEINEVLLPYFCKKEQMN